MVADPCAAPLVPGLFGSEEGLMARVKSTHGVKGPGPGFTSGYCLWAPDYATFGAGGSIDLTGKQNLWVWQTDDANSHPSNLDTSVRAFGTDQNFTTTTPSTTWALKDPANPLLTTDLCADMRTVNACMQMTYYGTLLESAGEVAYISNVPIENLINGNGVPPASVNELMQHATNKKRLGVDTLENIYRPNPSTTHFFRDEAAAGIEIDFSTPDNPAVLSTEAQQLSPRVFGFVWRNTQPDAGIVFDFTKGIEWRPEVASGLAQHPVHSTGSSLLPGVNAIIDKHESRSGKQVWERAKVPGTNHPTPLNTIMRAGAYASDAARHLPQILSTGSNIIGGLRTLNSAFGVAEEALLGSALETGVAALTLL